MNEPEDWRVPAVLPNDVVLPYDDGKVKATGSVWKLYFEGEQPSEEQVARALGSLGAIKTQFVAEGATARVTPTIKKENA